MRRLQTGSCKPFFVEDYKPPSERCSQHVCGAALGLYGGVGDIIYRRGAPGHCIFAAHPNQEIESDQRHNCSRMNASTSHDRKETVSPSCVPAIAYVSHLIFSGSTRVWERYILCETTQTERRGFISRTITNFWCEYYGRLIPSASVLGVFP